MSGAADRARPPFRAEHVGSLLRPPHLKEAVARARVGSIDAAKLEAIRDDCIRDVVAVQEAIGLAVITDGEFRRNSFHHFLEKLEGTTTVLRSEPVGGAASKSFEPRTYGITGKLRRPQAVEVAAFRYLKTLTQRVVKVALASPTMLLRAGRDEVDRSAYPELAELMSDIGAVYAAEIRDLADAGCTYVQLDDTNYAYLCDQELRARRQLGGGADPEALAQRYAALINDSIAARPAGMTVCVHVCRGNFAGNFAASGGYEPIADVLLNELMVDGYLLEYDDARSGGFEPLRFLPKGTKKKIVLGLVSTKSSRLESKDELKRRIDAATKFVPLQNLCLSPQCGFSSTIEGNPLTTDSQRRKLELVVETAQEVWGTVA